MKTFALNAALLLAAAAFAVPEKTLMFPGSGTTAFETDGKVLVAGTGWTRENGASIWDVSNPADMKYMAAVRARGYTTARPVFVGNRVYMPLWFGAVRIDISDPAKASIEDLMDFDFPNHTCDWIVRDGNELAFVTRTGSRVYDVSDPSRPAVFAHASTNVPPAAPSAPKDPRAKLLPQAVRGNARFVGDVAFGYDRNRSSYRTFRFEGTNVAELCERFMLHSLSTVAVVGGRAYVYAATQPMTHGVLSLDLAKDGYVDFAPGAVFQEPPPRGTDAFTMLMQSVGAIADLGGGYLLADDGLVKLDAQGRASFAVPRECPVCNYAFDGKRVLLAQSRVVRLADLSAPGSVRETARWVADDMTHATGAALDGADCWILTQERQGPGKGFLTYVPPKSTLRKLRADGTNLVETARCDLPPSASCVHVADGILYVAGLSHRGEHNVTTIVDGCAMKILDTRTDISEGSAYKIKRFGNRIFLSDTRVGIKELDFADSAHPRVKGVWRRSKGDNPAYDDFTVADGRLYALSHSSLDIYALDAAESPEKLEWDSPRFARNFGAVEKQRLALGDGLEAVAFGEGGLILFKDGKYLSELPPTPAGLCAISADKIRLGEGGKSLYVTDVAAKTEGVVDISDPSTPRLITNE